MSIRLINRSPEPDETSVPTNATLWLDIATDDYGGTIDLSSVEVRVDGVLAFDAGSFQTGFTGPESAYSNPQTNVLRVGIDPNDPIAGTTLHTVEVIAQLTGDPTTALSDSYSFTTEDLQNPTIVEAVAIALDQVRVTFSEAILSSSTSGDGDATNPSSWSLELVEGSEQTRLPAVSAEVESVSESTDLVFVVSTDIELTPGASYDLTADVVDVAGNPILTADATVRIVGYQPDVPPERDFDLLHMLPQKNVDDDTSGDLANFVGVWQEIAELLLYEIDAFSALLDPDTAPEDFVDAMLADLGNPFDFELSLADRRRLLQVLVPIYRQKGTNAGIINAIRFFQGIDVTITELAATGGYLGLDTLGGTLTLGTSSLALRLTLVVVVPQTLTDDEETTMRKLIEYMIRGECHYQISAPSTPPTIDHWALGASRLGSQTILH